jgi:hypothetical protein
MLPVVDTSEQMAMHQNRLPVVRVVFVPTESADELIVQVIRGVAIKA